MQTFEQTFAGAATWTLNVPGSYFTILGCTNTVSVRFYLGGRLLDLGKISSLLAGLEVLPKPHPELGYSFDRVEIDASAADTITIGIGNGEARYNRSAGSVSVSNTAGAYSNSRATVTAAAVTTLLAASASRRYVFVQNNSAADYLRITCDGVDPTIAQGIRIAPGNYWESPANFAPTGAVKAIAEAGAGAAVEVMGG